MPPSDLAVEALAAGLAQPDQRTCGSAVLVAARILNDPAYAAFLVNGLNPATGQSAPGTVQDRFRSEAMAMHRRTNAVVDVRGRLQLPWPRRYGTAPWAVARQLTGSSGMPGTTYRARLVLRHQRIGALRGVRAAVTAGHVVPLFAGNRWCARHVVLVIEGSAERLMIFDPARGLRYRIDDDDFVRGRLDVAGWRVPWFVVVPTGRR